jgi:hypothetical protein
MIRKSIRMAGFSWRPYVLRRYFDSRMMLAQADGLIIRDFRVFWMGHKGDIEHTYTLNKKLSSDIIEKCDRHMLKLRRNIFLPRIYEFNNSS